MHGFFGGARPLYRVVDQAISADQAKNDVYRAFDGGAVGVEPAAVEIVTAPSKSNPEGFRRKRVALLTAAARVRHRLWRRPAAGGARSLTFLYLTGSRVIRRLRADSA